MRQLKQRGSLVRRKSLARAATQSHLDPWVALEEQRPRTRLRPKQELDSPGRSVLNRSRECDRGLEHLVAHRRIETYGWGHLQNLLPPPLDGAIALKEVGDFAGAIAQQLLPLGGARTRLKG